jgi:hypothetical protein
MECFISFTLQKIRKLLVFYDLKAIIFDESKTASIYAYNFSRSCFFIDLKALQLRTI